MKNRNLLDGELILEDVLIQNGLLDDLFRYNDIKNRRLVLNAEIDSCTVSDVARAILKYNADDKGVDPSERTPVVLYILSCGGEVGAGFELIDLIECSKTPVYTVNMAYEYSMAFLIGLAGHKRYSLKNATFLTHDGSSRIYDSSAKAQDAMDFMKKIDNKIKDYVLSKTNITKKEYDSKRRTEWYMLAEEAKERGIIDYIVGVDCDIDEII